MKLAPPFPMVLYLANGFGDVWFPRDWCGATPTMLRA